MPENVLKFIPGDRYYIKSPQGYFMAKNYVMSEIKFSVYKDHEMLGVRTNFRAALTLCVQHYDSLSTSIDLVDQSEIPKEFKNSVAPGSYKIS